MRLLIPIIAVGFVVIAYVMSRRFADAHEKDQIRDFEAAIRGQDLLGQCQALKDQHIRAIRQNATLFRSSITALVGVVVAAFFCLAWLQNISDNTRAEARRACNADLTFRRLIEDQRVEDIRVKQHQRDDLADNTATAEDRTAAIPGFSDLPVAVRTFFGNAIRAQAAMAAERLAELDDDLGHLREQLDEIRAFNLESHCQ